VIRETLLRMPIDQIEVVTLINGHEYEVDPGSAELDASSSAYLFFYSKGCTVHVATEYIVAVKKRSQE
jgi:hypothetical protein